MSIKASVAREPFPAHRALVGLFPRMNPAVCVKVSFLAKAFPAPRALIGSFPRVDSLVSVKVGAAREPFPAGGALVRPLALASLAVPEKVELLAKPLPAVGALEWLFSRVDVLVLKEVRALAKPLPIRSADAWSLTSVTPPLVCILLQILECAPKRDRHTDFSPQVRFLVPTLSASLLAETGNVLSCSPNRRPTWWQMLAILRAVPLHFVEVRPPFSS